MSKNTLKGKGLFSNISVLEPFTQDLNKEIHGRELARELNSNQKTVQNKLNDLEEKNILESEEKGRLKEFKLNKNNPATKNLLITTEIEKLQKILQKSFEAKEIIKEILQKTEKPIIVYGSFAKGTWDKNSDLDILIIGEKEKKVEEINKKYSRKIQYMYLKPKEFKQQLKEKTSYIKEILKNHVICQGFEKITNWRLKYE
ncbi:MAG: nucleotidyltransferase domain-containing protein [archaeon]